MSEVLPIAVDAMGGDHAPQAIVEGALRAAHRYQCPITLVGPRDRLETLLGGAEGAATASRGLITVENATQVVEMDEHPASAVRTKPDSSIVRACQLAAQGSARAVVSAGNSGACLAASLFVLKRIPGVARPAIGGVFPGLEGDTFVLDVGANTDCKPEWLAQFGVMGSVYARTMMGRAEPRVALLSNGEERGKGSQPVQEAAALFDRLDLNFVGNIEGRDLFQGTADVVVCDGFVGNVALKTGEGAGEFLFAVLKQAALSNLRGKAGGLLLKPMLQSIRDRVDYRATGGALLLGVRHEMVIAHGRSDGIAIMNAIRVAREAADAAVSSVIADAIASHNSAVGATAEGVH